MHKYFFPSSAFLFFVIGYFGINNIAIFHSYLTTIAGVMLSLDSILNNFYYRNDYDIYDKVHPSLGFYNIPFANAQEQKEGKDKNNNNNENDVDKFVILIFDRGYK